MTTIDYSNYKISPPIKDEAYKELEAIVGPEFVTREPAVLDGYTWQTLWNTGPEMYIHRPVAVVLPASTEEVQAIVRCCNKHKIHFKAFTTGWGVFAGCHKENQILIEMRRMDKILEIDEKNMYVVVEPHAIGGQIVAEVMRKGLHCHIISSGPASSPLASATSFQGCAPDGIHMSWSSRNLMGAEWVTPDGEIVRVGSLGSNGEWWSGDGPGPSLRGVIRGRLGAFGGNGVFTKCALKLYNWPCQPVPEPEGLFFDTELELPPNCNVLSFIFPDRDALADATQAIMVEGIGYNVIKPSMGGLLSQAMPHFLHHDVWKNESSLLKRLIGDFNNLFLVVLACNSPEELAWQETVIRDCVNENKGVVIDVKALGFGDMPFWLFMLNTIYPVAFRTTGCFITAVGQDESHHSMVAMTPHGVEIKRKFIEKENGILDDGGEAGIHFFMEDGIISHYEEPVMFDHRIPEEASNVVPIELSFAAMQMSRCMESGSPTPIVRMLQGPTVSNYNKWQQAWARSINPDSICEDKYYSADPEPGSESVMANVPQDVVQRVLELAQKLAWGPDGPPD